MNLTSIRAEAGLLFGDAEFRHISEEQWDILLNRAESRIAEIGKILTTRVSCDSITADTMLYDLSPGGFCGSDTDSNNYEIIEVRRLIVEGKEVTGATEDELLSESLSFRDTDSGSIKYWYVTDSFKLGLYPPSDTEIADVKADIAHYPTQDIGDNVDEVPQINRLFHRDITNLAGFYAAMQGTDRDRAEYFRTIASEGIMEHVTQFNNRKGFNMDTSIPDFPVFT